MVEPSINIIEWLNKNFDGGDALIGGLIASFIWEVLWHFIIEKLLRKTLEKRQSDFISTLLELGGFGTFGAVLFFLLIGVMVAQTIILIFEYPKAILPGGLFLAFVIGFFVFVFKYINK